ncbi:MAG TPA: DUF2079 domain-containing protein [Ktedonobacterales bacterium]
MPDWLTARRAVWALVVAMTIAFALVVGYHALQRHWDFQSDAFDLGNMDQAVWNTLHGHPFRFTNRGNDDFGLPTRLSIHVEPIILLLAPLYLIHSGPETLIVVQILALALGALPLVALSLRRMPRFPCVGVGLVAAYMLSPFTIGLTLWEFHPVSLAAPLLLFALWALDTRHYRWFLAAIILAMATKEDIGLAVAVITLLLALVRPEKRRFGALVALGALVWVAICFKIILPHFNVGVAGGNNYWYRYSWLGATPAEALIQALTHPLDVWNYLFSPGRTGYLLLILRTGGALWLLAPALMLAAAPDLVVNLLSSHSEQYSGFFQYNAVIVACALIAAVYGTAGLARARLRAQRDPDPRRLATARAETGAAIWAVREGGWRAAPAGVERAIGQARALWSALLERIPIPVRWLQPVLLVWLLAMSLSNLTAVGRVQSFWDAGDAPNASESARMVAMNQLLARIPTDASVCATDTIDPHVSDRYDLYLAPDILCYQAQYVAMDVISAVHDVEVPDALMLYQMRHSDHYTLVGETHGLVVLRRVGAPLTPLPGLSGLSQG